MGFLLSCALEQQLGRDSQLLAYLALSRSHYGEVLTNREIFIIGLLIPMNGFMQRWQRAMQRGCNPTFGSNIRRCRRRFIQALQVLSVQQGWTGLIWFRVYLESVFTMHCYSTLRPCAEVAGNRRYLTDRDHVVRAAALRSLQVYVNPCDQFFIALYSRLVLTPLYPYVCAPSTSRVLAFRM